MFKKIRSHLKRNAGLYVFAVMLAVMSVSIYTAEAINPARYVTQAGAGLRNGYSWENALGEAEFCDLTRAEGTEGEFWVAEGVYRPSVTGDEVQFFMLQPGMKIYGGFAGDEESLSQRDPYKYRTVFTADLADDDINKTGGVTWSTNDISGMNSEKVLVVTGGSTADTVIDGVIITAANNAGGTDGIGGGILVSAGSPLIRNCIFAGNRSETLGAGIASSGTDAAPVIDSCTFYGNQTLGKGGAVYLGSELSGSLSAGIVNSTFYFNSAGNGGAICLSSDRSTVINCTMVDNEAQTAGGGIFTEGTDAVIKNNILWWNRASDGAEIKLAAGASASVSYCVVEEGYPDGTDIITDDPFIGIFDYNGGPTKTFTMDPGSSAINAGDAEGAPVFDQRGAARTDAPDIGSVEYSTAVSAVYVDPSSRDLKVGDLSWVNATVFPTEAQAVTTVEWESSSSDIASVSNGIVTANSEGEAVISASAGDFSGTCLVSVTKIVPVIQSLPTAGTITYGATLAESALTGGSASTGGSFAWTDTGIVPVVADSETTEFDTEFIPLDEVKYARVTTGVKLTVNRADIIYNAEDYYGEYDGELHGITVSAAEPISADIMYGTSFGTYDLTSPPLYREIGSYTTYFRITDDNYNTVENGKPVVICPIETPVEVTDDTKTDSEYSGGLTVGVNTAEDIKIYDAMLLLEDDGILPSGINPVSADALPAVSADISTSDEIFTKEEILEAVSKYWNINAESRDIAIALSVANTVGADAAYQERDGSLFAKAFRFITELFTGRTGEEPGESDYLPLEVKMTVTAAEIEKLPESIRTGLGAHNFLERISVFALAHKTEGGADARSLYDITESGTIPRYTTVSQVTGGGYQIKTRFLVFNMPGGVTEGPGSPFIQPMQIKEGAVDRPGSYYLFQDGIRDGYYDLCTVLAVKTLKGKLSVTVSGFTDPLSADWSVSGTDHPEPLVRAGTDTLLLEKDLWSVSFDQYDGYELTTVGDLEKDLKWEEDWNIQAAYLAVQVTGISSDIQPSETLKLRMNVEGGNTHQLHAEVVPSNALNKNIIWTSSDPDKISVDQTGLITALALCEEGAAVTAASEEGGYAAVQQVTATNIVKGIEISESATIRVGEDPFSVQVSVVPDDASDKRINWSSSDTAVAVVNEQGSVTAVASGTAVIQAVAADGDGSSACTGTCTVTVLPAVVHVTEVSVDPASLTLNIGYSRIVTAAVLPEDATDKSVIWSTNNASVADVSSEGRITAVSEGTAVITATAVDGGAAGTCAVTVKRIPTPVIPVLPDDTPDSVRAEVRPVAAAFSKNKDAVLARFKEGIISPENLVINPDTEFVEVKSALAVQLFNNRDEYKPIGADMITKLPVFGVNVEIGKTAAVGFKLKGSDLFAAVPADIKVLKILSDTESEYFTYASSSATFAGGRYTLQTEESPIYTGTIEADAEYLLVLFIKDGSEYDLDGTENGEVIDPTVIVKAEEKDDPDDPDDPTPSGPDDGGGGCNASLPLQMLFLAVPLAFRKKR